MYISRPVASAISLAHIHVSSLRTTKENCFLLDSTNDRCGSEPWDWANSLYAVAKLHDILKKGTTIQEFIFWFVSFRTQFYDTAFNIINYGEELDNFPRSEMNGNHKTGEIRLEQTEDQISILRVLGAIGVIQNYAEGISRRPQGGSELLSYRTRAPRSQGN